MASESDTRERRGRGSNTKAKVKPWLCRLPEELDRKLAKRAFDERRPKSEIVRDALTEYLK